MKQQPASHADLPEQKYFRIGEVSRLVGVDTHVLRYWETEFTVVRPFRTRSGQRLYRHQDVLLLRRIRALLHEEGYTIAGARKIIGQERNTPNHQPALQHDGILIEIKNGLLELKKILSRTGGGMSG